MNEYFGALVDAQRAVLRNSLTAQMHRYLQLSRELWVLEKTSSSRATCPLQIALLVARVYFTFRLEHALFSLGLGDPQALVKYLEICQLQLGELVRLSQSRLTQADRVRVENMILLDANGLDVCNALIAAEVSSSGHFLWQSRLRFRHVGAEAGDVECSILASNFSYGFEYIDHREQLSVTPTAERVYVTTALALRRHVGVAVIGKDSSGKRAILSSLAKSLGQHAVTVDCLDSHDAGFLESTLAGVLACGCWGIFLHLDRLVPAALSFFAHMSHKFRDRLRSGNLNIAESELRPIPHPTLLLTYRPRSYDAHIPREVKASFRPASVLRPDFRVICEHFLIVAGFKDCTQLSQSVVDLYHAAPIFLEARSRGIWSLSYMKRILSTLGPLRRDADYAHLSDSDLLFRTFRDLLLPGVEDEDREEFLQTTACCFPGAQCRRDMNEALGEQVANACDDAGLWADISFTHAVLQLGMA